jgi:hypothetical protein
LSEVLPLFKATDKVGGSLLELIIDKNFLFREGIIGGLLLACQGMFRIVLHRKPVAGDAIW